MSEEGEIIVLTQFPINWQKKMGIGHFDAPESVPAVKGDGWYRSMHLGFCTGNAVWIPGRASEQASQSPHMDRLAFPLEQGGSSSAMVLMDIVLNPQPTSQWSKLCGNSLAYRYEVHRKM